MEINFDHTPGFFGAVTYPEWVHSDQPRAPQDVKETVLITGAVTGKTSAVGGSLDRSEPS